MILQPLLPLWILAVMLGLLGAITLFRLRHQIHRSWRPSLLQVRRSLMVLLLFLIASGFSITSEVKSPGISNVDVLVLFDTTQSMAALDYDAGSPRLSGAKKDLKKIVSDLNGASFGIITFDTRASTLLPFSNNQQTVQAAVDSIQVELAVTAKGSQIDKPLDTAKSQLEARRASSPERQLLLIYIGDGENTAGDTIKSFSELKTFINGGIVLGYGTNEGAKMIKNKSLALDQSSTDYVKTYDQASKSFQSAISKPDFKNLNTIATDLGVQFAQRSTSRDASIDLTAEIQKLDGGERKIRVYQNLYFIFAVPLGLLLTYECLQLLLLRRLANGGAKK